MNKRLVNLQGSQSVSNCSDEVSTLPDDIENVSAITWFALFEKNSLD